MEKTEQERVFTPEELEVKRKEMLKFYKDSMPYLKAQFEHEELLMKIDEVRFKRTNLQMQYAMMMNQMENGPEGEEDDKEEYPFPTPQEVSNAEAISRKLKKN
jgi:hypothetical protein